MRVHAKLMSSCRKRMTWVPWVCRKAQNHRTIPSFSCAAPRPTLSRYPLRHSAGGLWFRHERSAMSISAINVRNQFRGKVKEIIEGSVVSEIDVETPAGLIVTSVITTRSVKDLGLVVGKEVIALVKSTEVSIAAL